MTSFRELKIWSKSNAIALKIAQIRLELNIKFWSSQRKFLEQTGEWWGSLGKVESPNIRPIQSSELAWFESGAFIWQHWHHYKNCFIPFRWTGRQADTYLLFACMCSILLWPLRRDELDVHYLVNHETAHLRLAQASGTHMSHGVDLEAFSSRIVFLPSLQELLLRIWLNQEWVRLA